MSLFNEDLPSSDSEDDADYVPDADNVPMSDEEEIPALTHFEGNETKPKADKEDEEKASEEIKSSVDEKQRANDLYKMFLAEVEEDEKKAKNSIACDGASSSTSFESGPSSKISGSEQVNVKSSLVSSDVSEKTSVDTPDVKPCELFDFAGETVAVSSDGNIVCEKKGTPECQENVPVKPEVKKRGGLESVINFIDNKRKKLSVLDKTSLDWKHFKKSEKIEDELSSFRKSKQGFIERQRFLERSDFRAYEIERDMRLSKSKKKK